jgi:hypothetical protein
MLLNMSSNNRGGNTLLGAQQQRGKNSNMGRKLVFGDDDDETVLDPELQALPEEVVHRFDKRMRNLNLALCVLTVVTILTTMAMLEAGWENHDEEAGIEGNYETHPGLTEPLKMIVSVLTVLSMALIYLMYNTQVYFDALMFKAQGRKTNLTIWTSDRRNSFLFELFICSLHAPAYISSITFYVDQTTGEHVPLIYDKVSVFVLFRIYFLLRTYRDWSRVYRWRQWILLEGQFKKNSPMIMFDTMFSIKDLFNYNPWQFVGAGVLMATLFFSYCIYIAERQEQPQFYSAASNCVWNTAVTMTTVGYGDFAVTSVYGRLMAMISAIVGISLSSLLVTAMMVSIEFSPNERIASQLVATRRAREDIRESAVRVIQAVWAQKKFLVDKEITSAYVAKVQKAKDPNVVFIRAIIMHTRNLGIRQKQLHHILSNDNQYLMTNKLTDLNQNIAEMSKQIEEYTDTVKLSSITAFATKDHSASQELVSENERLKDELRALENKLGHKNRLANIMRQSDVGGGLLSDDEEEAEENSQVRLLPQAVASDDSDGGLSLNFMG